MFQEKERMEYLNEQAPEELKNRTWSSIQQENKKRAKQRRQGLVMAACFACVLLTSNVLYQNSTIVKVNDVPISYLNVSIGQADGDLPFAISEKRNEDSHYEIPMDIDVSGKAHIKVSEGSIRIENDSVSQKEVKELEIMGKTVICWNVNGDNNIATCIITTEDTQYQYEMEKNESGWKIRLKQKN